MHGPLVKIIYMNQNLCKTNLYFSTLIINFSIKHRIKLHNKGFTYHTNKPLYNNFIKMLDNMLLIFSELVIKTSAIELKINHRVISHTNINLIQDHYCLTCQILRALSFYLPINLLGTVIRQTFLVSFMQEDFVKDDKRNYSTNIWMTNNKLNEWIKF
jgi:hypothetical protein